MREETLCAELQGGFIPYYFRARRIMFSRAAKTCSLRPGSRYSFLINSIRRFSGIDLEKPCQELNFIDGHRQNPVSNEDESEIYIMEPATGRILCETQGSGKLEVDRAVQSAREAFSTWSVMSGMERGKVLRNAANIIRSRVKDLATVEVTDNGEIVFVSSCVYI